MRASFTSFVVLSAVSSSLAAWVPLSSLQNRANSSFLDCLEGAGLDPVVQGESDYATDAAPFNLRFDWKPAALVYPNDSAGVAAAVKCGAANGIKVNARSGGHSYAAFALGGEDGHLTVDLNNLRHLSVSGDTATIGAGNRLGDVALYLWENGQRAMAHGTCPYVGIGGHAGQGGFGLPSRAWGILADQVQSLEIVTADGSIRTASRSENSDLFWAATGAGASFGIIISYTTVTHEALDSVAFSYTFANYGAAEASKGLQAWQKFANDPSKPLDVSLGLQAHVAPGDSPSGVVFSVSGQYYGADEAKVNATMAPLLAELGEPSATFMQAQDWITSVLYLAGTTGLDSLNTTLAPDTHDDFYATSTFVSLDEPLGAPSTDAVMEYFYGPGATSKVAWFVIFDLWGGGDSVINKVGADYNAFNARDALYSIQYYGTIPSSVSDADGIAFIQGMKGAIEDNQPQTFFKEYVNYIDSTYSADVAHKKYYPTHTARLTELKDKYDPNRVIHHPQDF
ncbi:FAD-binding domain-containing protein [Cerioporus squamosus]|nr:FAD-binding domain-containing protein [Cerioporus squamosus]